MLPQHTHNNNIHNTRALVNWGKALVGRAELASDRTAGRKLYNAAIDKFEAVLEEDPDMLVAKYRCALAMQVGVGGWGCAHTPHMLLIKGLEMPSVGMLCRKVARHAAGGGRL